MTKAKVYKGKTFTVKVNDADIKLYFRRPNQKELFEIDAVFRASMTRLLERGVMTTHKASKLFRDSGEWTPQEDQELKNLAVLIGQNRLELDRLKNTQPHVDNMKIVDRLGELRNKQFELIAKRTDLFSNCAERLSEEQKMHALIILCCCREEDDERLFSNDEEYQKFVKESPETASTILVEAYNFDYNVDPATMSDDWTEMKYLREYLASKKEESAETEEASNEVVKTE